MKICFGRKEVEGEKDHQRQTISEKAERKEDREER